MFNLKPRVKAAKNLMSNWKKNQKISCIVMNIEQLYESFIHLAYTELPCLSGESKKNIYILPKYKYNNTYYIIII